MIAPEYRARLLELLTSVATCPDKGASGFPLPNEGLLTTTVDRENLIGKVVRDSTDALRVFQSGAHLHALACPKSTNPVFAVKLAIKLI